MTGGTFTPGTTEFLRAAHNPRLLKPFAAREVNNLLSGSILQWGSLAKSI